MTDIPKVRKILVLAANPKGTVRLRLDQEVRDIQEGLQRSKQRDQFVVEQRLSVRPRDIQRALMDVEPQILHFLGHGTSNEGLVFEDNAGNAQVVSGEALANLFALFSEQLECVVLNGCYSAEQADAIAQQIPFVVGVRQSIENAAAIEFAVGFYDALGNGRTVEFAHKLGCSAIELAGFEVTHRPVLLTKTDEIPISPLPAPVEGTDQPKASDAAGNVHASDRGISVFFSYAHEDEDLRDELAKHLRNMERRGIISSWYDRDISAGSEWAKQIDSSLDEAQIILLLISSDFMDSDYCNAVELKRAMERHRNGNACVIPVILRPTDWKGAEFDGLQALPKNALPVTKWADRDEAFLDITKGIRRVAEGLKKNMAVPPKEPTDSERLVHLSSSTKKPFVLPQVDIGTFTGRKKELEQLKALLINAEKSRVCSIVGLSGGGGIGKSALAAHFATEYKDAFPDGVIGLRVEDKDVNTIARDFILELYKYTGQDLDPEEEREAAVLMEEAFGHLKMLLIFDNADNANALQALVNAVGQSAIIITTRDRGLPVSLNVPQAGIVDVPVLPTADSLRLLKRIIGEDRVSEEEEAAHNIIQIVENLPLALQIAGAYLKLQIQRKLRDYAAYLREEKKRLSRLKFQGDEQLNLRASFELSLSLLRPEVIDFFSCLSVCGRDSFSRRAAMAAGGLEDEFETQELIDPLYRLSLINYAEAGENRFVLHSLIHLFAQEIAENKKLFDKAKARHASFFISLIEESDLENELTVQQIAEEFDDIILSVNWLQTQPKPEYEFAMKLLPIFQKFGYWEKAVEIMNGLQHLAEIREDWHGVVQFRIQQAKYLNLLEKIDESEIVLNPVEAILKRISDQSSRLYCEASWLTTLRGILMGKGLINEAIEILYRVIEINEVRGDAQSICIGLNTLGKTLQQQQRWDEAIAVLQRAVEIAETLENSKSLKISLNAFGGVLQQQQRWDEAIAVLRRAVTISETLKDFQSLRISLNVLAGVLQQQQHWDEAIAVLRRAVEISEALESPQSLSISLNALGGVLQQCQRWDEAIAVLQRAVEISETLENPQSLSISLNALGGVLQQCQRWDEAVLIHERTARIAEDSDDLNALQLSLFHLGNIFQQQQLLNKSLELLKSASQVSQRRNNPGILRLYLSRLRKFLPPCGSQEEILTTLSNSIEVAKELGDLAALRIAYISLGDALGQYQKWDEAIETRYKAIEVSQESGDKQMIVSSLNSLGDSLLQSERWDEATAALQRAVEVAETSENLQILSISLNALVGVLLQSERWDKAIAALQRAVEIAETLENPQQLSISLNALGGVLRKHQRWDKAIETLQRAVEVDKTLENPQQLSISLHALGGVLQQRQRWDEAIVVLQRAVEVDETLGDPQSLIISLNALGGVLQQRQCWDEAIVVLQRAVKVAETAENYHSLSISLNALGGVLQERQRWDEAITAFQRTVELTEELLDDQLLVVALSLQGRTLQLKRQPQDAMPILLRGLEISEDLEDSRSLGILLNTLGGVYKDLKQWEKSEHFFRRCFDLAHKEKNVMGKAIALNGLGQVLEKQGSEKFGLAMATFRESIKLGEKESNSSHLAKVHTAMGQALFANGKIEDAIVHLKQSFEIDVASRNQRGVSLIMFSLSPALTRQGRRDEAIQYMQRALKIAPSHKGLLNLHHQLTGGNQVTRNKELVQQGIVKFIRQNKTGIRDGYITPVDGSRDIYFREGFIDISVIDRMDAGTLVEVEIKQQPKGPCAKSIRLLPEIGEVS